MLEERTHRRVQHLLMGYPRPVELLDAILYDLEALRRRFPSSQ